MKTAKGYKLFREHKKTGKLYPLYVNARKEVPVGKWIEAEMGESKDNGMIKARGLNEVAVRGGWHLNEEAPYVEHIYSKYYNSAGDYEDERGTFFKVHKVDEGNYRYVWCEVEYETTNCCQQEADEAGTVDGRRIARFCQLRMVKPHSYYRYKTNPNMFGTWIIASHIRVKRRLEHFEVLKICREYNLTPLPQINAMKNLWEM